MKFDEQGRLVDFGLPGSELDDIINSGLAFRTSGCPGKFQDDISACDRPYGDSPPSDIASYPFQPKKKDLKKIERTRQVQRRNRRDVLQVALAGYTNAGKSTLFNRITRTKDALVDDFPDVPKYRYKLAFSLQIYAAETFATVEHQLHEEGSAGADCIECHMPATT